MPQNDLEYVLFVETPNYGPIGLLLRDNGKHLGFARGGDPSFYRLVGVEPPPNVEIGNEMIGRIRGVKPDWKIPLHGEWQNIGDVVELLYSQNIDMGEEVSSHKSFFDRNRYKAAAIISIGAMGSIIGGPTAAVVFDAYKVLIYSIEGSLLAGILGGGILYLRGLFPEQERKDKLNSDLTSHIVEIEAIREGVIRAGVLDGILPQDYGLPR